MNTRQRGEFEPVDKHVRRYEIGLAFVAAVTYIAAMRTHFPATVLAAVVANGLLIATCLWNLLVPPRFSATRCTFLCFGLICLYLLVGYFLVGP